MIKTYDKNTGDHTVCVEITPKDFQSSFSILRSVALEDLKFSLVGLLKLTRMSDHDVGLIRGRLSAYVLTELITKEEYQAFTLAIDTFHYSDIRHCFHVVSFYASRC